MKRLDTVQGNGEGRGKTVSLRKIRREIILAAATDLLRQQGYDGVSIDAIGAAAGVTGPAVYRHFKSKQEILVALIDRGTDRLWDDMKRVLEEDAESPFVAMVALVEAVVALAIDERYLIAAYHHERNLPEGARKRLHRRQRQMLDEWIKVLARVRPDLSADEANTAMLAVFGLISAVGHNNHNIDRARVQQLVTDMAVSAILVSARDAAGLRPGSRARRSRAGVAVSG